MSALPQTLDRPYAFAPQVVLPAEHETTVKAWLRGEDPSITLGHLMYYGDKDATRWARGHSSDRYYVKKEETKVFAQMERDIDGEYDVLVDAGVGGEAATLRALKIAARLNVKGYVGIDLAVNLAQAAAEVADRSGFKAAALNADIFEPLTGLPGNIRSLSETLGKQDLKTVMGVFGLTPGNLECFDSYEELERRDIAIHKNYARVVAPRGGLVTGWDACMDPARIVACYDSPEFGELIRTAPGRFMDLKGLSFVVTAKELQSINDPARKAVRLLAGLYAARDGMLHYAGEEFEIRKGRILPVVLSYRINLPGKEHIIQEGGFRRPRDNQIWNAGGSIHYAHCGL